jgi:hypothetical protein
MDTFDFVQEFGDYLKRNPKSAYVYAGQKPSGLFMVKPDETDSKYVFKCYTTKKPITPGRLLEFMLETPTFKGRKIDKYIFVGYSFSVLSCKLPKTNNNLSLILFGIKHHSIAIYGAVNLDDAFLNHLIAFAESKKLSVTYDFEGQISRKLEKRSSRESVIKSERREKTPRVFLSYSWDNSSHKDWVLKLAAALIRNGIDVLIDEWDLEKHRNDLHLFMETGISESDYVIMVCTQNYATRANKREGGVGIENTIITGQFYDEDNSNKFIPIVRNYSTKISDSLPSYLKTKYTVDFSKDDLFLESLDELMRRVLGIPKYKKPSLGRLPKLSSQEI